VRREGGGSRSRELVGAKGRDDARAQTQSDHDCMDSEQYRYDAPWNEMIAKSHDYNHTL